MIKIYFHVVYRSGRKRYGGAGRNSLLYKYMSWAYIFFLLSFSSISVFLNKKCKLNS